jgi:hypothetical protein
MRRQWYGDKRDIAKWSILLQLAREEGLVEVVQILWLRPDDPMDWTQSDGDVPLSAVAPEIRNAVWEHFRPELSSVENIRLDGITIRVPHPVKIVGRGRERRGYADATLAYLGNIGRPVLVFLDPDTGLSSGSAPKPVHVSADETRRYWDALRSGDWLVLYQHHWRSKTWKKESSKRFAEAVGIATSGVRCLSLPKIAHDVVFVAANKS